jgi:hypothetical protein
MAAAEAGHAAIIRKHPTTEQSDESAGAQLERILT